MPRTGVWTADRRIYLTQDGRAVEHGHPDAHQLLVVEGGTLPLDEAERLGLVHPKAKAKHAAPEDKALHQADDKAVGRKRTKRDEDGA